MNYFLIPGNPPAVSFYKLWQNEIMEKHHGAKVRVSHYPKLTRTNDSVKAMNDIFACHLDQLKTFYYETSAPITIIGHSLGGHFALRLLEESDEVIERSILLHPFLRTPKKRGQLILKMVTALHSSDKIQKTIVANRKILEYFSDELPYVSTDEMDNTFHIAKHESVIIASDQSPLKIAHHHREKILVFYHLQDTWCTKEVIKDLRGQVPLIECTEPHGFITNSKDRLSLLARILEN